MVIKWRQRDCCDSCSWTIAWATSYLVKGSLYVQLISSVLLGQSYIRLKEERLFRIRTLWWFWYCAFTPKAPPSHKLTKMMPVLGQSRAKRFLLWYGSAATGDILFCSSDQHDCTLTWRAAKAGKMIVPLAVLPVTQPRASFPLWTLLVWTHSSQIIKQVFLSLFF